MGGVGDCNEAVSALNAGVCMLSAGGAWAAVARPKVIQTPKTREARLLVVPVRIHLNEEVWIATWRRWIAIRLHPSNFYTLRGLGANGVSARIDCSGVARKNTLLREINVLIGKTGVEILTLASLYPNLGVGMLAKSWRNVRTIDRHGGEHAVVVLILDGNAVIIVVHVVKRDAIRVYPVSGRIIDPAVGFQCVLMPAIGKRNMSDFRLERGKTSLGLNLRYRRAGHNNCPFRAGSRIALVVQIVIRGKIAFYVSRGVRRLWKMVWVEREWPLCEQVTDRVLGIEVDAVELLSLDCKRAFDVARRIE
jgi:hypothetical protein